MIVTMTNVVSIYAMVLFMIVYPSDDAKTP